MLDRARHAGPSFLFVSLLCLAAGPARAQTAAGLTHSEQEARLTVHLERGRRYWRTRRFTESAAAYRRATRVAPRNARCFAGARAYAALGAYRYAVPAYRHAIELLPDAPAALHTALGDTLLAMGDRDGAWAAYLLALRRDPANEAARQGHDRILARGRMAPAIAPRGPTVLDRQLIGPTAVAPPGGPGVPLVAGGVPLAVIGLGAGVGCAVASSMEPDGASTARAGSDSLTWVACMATGALTAGIGLVMIGVGLNQGVEASTTARAAGDVQLDIGPTRGGAVASAMVTF